MHLELEALPRRVDLDWPPSRRSGINERSDGLVGRQAERGRAGPVRTRVERHRVGLAGSRANGVLRGVSIADIAPTVLALLGMKVPEDMDGESLIEADKGEASESGEGHDAPAEHDEEIKKRLGELGYL